MRDVRGCLCSVWEAWGAGGGDAPTWAEAEPAEREEAEEAEDEEAVGRVRWLLLVSDGLGD